MKTVLADGNEYELSPLSINEIVRFIVECKALRGEAKLYRCVEFIHASLSKKHPSLTPDMLADKLTASIFDRVIDEILNASETSEVSAEFVAELAKKPS